LASRVLREGEPVAWRGPEGVHRRYALSGGIEVRLDQDPGQSFWTLWPHYEVEHRLRVAVRSVTPLPDSPFDVLLAGIANPPPPPRGAEGADGGPGDDYPITTYLSDARRLPSELPPGHVLAVSVAGFALDVTYLGPNEGVQSAMVAGEPSGAALVPLGGGSLPSAAMELSLTVQSVRRFHNPVTKLDFDVLVTDAPGRPLELFLSRWQLESEGFEPPRAGWRIEGAFLFTGRVAGGLPSVSRRVRRSFG
jgi:hypothetical protein